METTITKKNKDASSSHPADETAISPIKVLRIEDVSASVFSRERLVTGQPITYYSVTFSRSYKDKAGTRQYAKTFNADDLGKLMMLAQQSREFIQSKGYPMSDPQAKN